MDVHSCEVLLYALPSSELFTQNPSPRIYVYRTIAWQRMAPRMRLTTRVSETRRRYAARDPMSFRTAVVHADRLALDSICVAPTPVKVHHVSEECVAPLFRHENKSIWFPLNII
jgi:hypothetical protein